MHQSTNTRYPNRSDHVWRLVVHEGLTLGYRCCLCGAFTSKAPPPYPTPPDYLPERYDRLTEAERGLAPFRPGACVE